MLGNAHLLLLTDTGLCASAVLMQAPLTIWWAVRLMEDKGWLQSSLEAATRLTLHLLGECAGNVQV